MPTQQYEQLEWSFTGNDSALNAAFQRAEASSKSHVSKVNTHLKGIGSSINVNEHFVNSSKNVEKEAQAHVGRLNSIFKHTGEGMKEGLGGIMSGALSVMGGGMLMGGLQKVEQMTEKLLELGMEHQSVWMTALRRMTAFTGSAEKADEILGHLHHMAIDRALEFSPLADAAFKLTEIGYKGPEIVNMFKGITAQAVALGKGSEGVQRLVGMLEMMEDSGKAAGRGLMQLERQGYQIFATLEKVTGLSRTFLRDALQKGKLDPRAAIGMLTEGWEQQYGELAGRLSQSFKDKQTRLTETMGEPLATIIQPLTRNAGKLVDDLRQIFEQVGPGLSEGLATGLDYAAGTLTKGLEYLITLTGIKLKTQSPSKVFEQYGLWVMQGLGDGFVKGASGAQSELEKAYGRILRNPKVQFLQQGKDKTSLESDTQKQIIATIIGVGRSLGATEKQILAALATGKVETDFQNLPYGMDKDNKGVFQQRNNWGSASSRMDVANSARMFYEEAKRVDSPNLSAGNLAQAVQRSGHPERYGQVIPRVLALLDQLGGQGGTYTGVSSTWTQGSPQVDPSSQRSAQREARIKEIEGKSVQAVELMATLFDRINMLRRELGYQEVNVNAPVGLAGNVHAPEPGVYPRAFAPDSPEGKARQTAERTLTAIETDYTEQLRINRDNLIELGKLHRQRQAEEKRVLDEMNARANLKVGTEFFGRLGAYGDTAPYMASGGDKDLPPQVKRALQDYAYKFGGFQEVIKPTGIESLTEGQKAIMAAGGDPGKFRRDAMAAVRPLEGAGKGVLDDSSILLNAALGKVQRSALNLSDVQETAFEKAVQRLPLNEEERRSLDTVILANRELSKTQKQAMADGLDKHELSKKEITALNALIFKYEDLNKMITAGLTQQVMEGSQNIAGAEKSAIVDLPKNLASVGAEFITKWDFTGKSAMQILTGGLRSVIVEPMGKIFQEITQKWIAQQLLNLLGDKVMGTAKVGSETANTIATNLNTAALIANTTAHTASTTSSWLQTFLKVAQTAAAAGAAGAAGGAEGGGGGIHELGHSFASGIDYVPHDMDARIHRGEAVIPASQNRKNGNTIIQVTQNLYAPVVGGSSYSHPRSRREMLEMFQPAMLSALVG